MILGTLRDFSSGSEEDEEEGLEAGECGVRGAAEDDEEDEEGLVGSVEDDDEDDELPREKRGILRKPLAPILIRRRSVLFGGSSVLVGDPSSAGLSLDFFM